VDFAENLSVSMRNATNYTFQVTTGLETFEIKVCYNRTEILKDGYVCVSIRMLTSHRESIRLATNFKIKTRQNGTWIRPNLHNEEVVTLSVNSSHIYIMKPKKRDISFTKEINEDDIVAIRMTGSFVIRGQHTITTSHAKFDPETHTSVNMSYTWTVCNLTLLDVNYPVNVTLALTAPVSHNSSKRNKFC
jgi:hypothetical protein